MAKDKNGLEPDFDYGNLSSESRGVEENPPSNFETLINRSPNPMGVESLYSDQKPPKRKRERKLFLAGVFIVIFVLVATLGFFGLRAWDSYKDQKQVEAQQAEEQAAEREKAKAIKEADHPFSVLIGTGTVDPPSEEPLEVTVEADQLKAGASTLTILGGGTLRPTANGCSLVAITDICLGARGSLGAGDFDVLVVKDISRTRILDNPSEFQEFKTSGSTIAASLAIDMGSNEGLSRFGALTTDGTTGFVLIFPAGTSAERVDEVLKAATVI